MTVSAISLQSPNNSKIGQKISFAYAGKQRAGTVEHVRGGAVCIKHDPATQAVCGGRKFSSYTLSNVENNTIEIN